MTAEKTSEKDKKKEPNVLALMKSILGAWQEKFPRKIEEEKSVLTASKMQEACQSVREPKEGVATLSLPGQAPSSLHGKTLMTPGSFESISESIISSWGVQSAVLGKFSSTFSKAEGSNTVYVISPDDFMRMCKDMELHHKAERDLLATECKGLMYVQLAGIKYCMSGELFSLAQDFWDHEVGGLHDTG